MSISRLRDEMAPLQPRCANWTPSSADCQKVGRYSCKGCLLILYCSPECQKSHWTIHKRHCKSPLAKKTWTPNWNLQKRAPAFVEPGPYKEFGGSKYVWGNVPAFDVLQLARNEGQDYGEELRLLFAASGDFRNVVKTIAELPRSYNQSLDVVLNDRDIDIVARNILMLLIALEVEDTDEAVDCIIHVWYSALIRQSHLSILEDRIRPLVEEVCEKVKNKAPSTLLGKTWTFGQRSLRIVLQKSSWDRLLSFTTVLPGLTVKRAGEIRLAVTLAESRKDYVDRHLLFQTPSGRVAKFRFREDGLLLPFGSPRDEFSVPNPTLFQTPNQWPMFDCADPLDGWSSKDIANTSSGPATADIYGKLYYHVRAVLGSFVSRLSDLKVSFRLFLLDVRKLPPLLEKNYFSRIEVSNIVDNAYVGVFDTLELVAPLLQGPTINPHATLITLFMNLVEDCRSDPSPFNTQAAEIEAISYASSRLFQYQGIDSLTSPSPSMAYPYDPETIKLTPALDSVIAFDDVFDRFLQQSKLKRAAGFLGLQSKEKHTVIDKWPFKMKLEPGEPGAREELDRLMSGGVTGKERYMEWGRYCVFDDEIEDEQRHDFAVR